MADRPAPKEQAEALLDAIMPFAERMLIEHGEFYPVAAVLDPAGEMCHVAGSSGDEQPAASEVREVLEGGLREQAAKGEIVCAIVLTNVTVTATVGGEARDAIHAAIEHRDGYSVDAYFPYQLSDGELEFADTIAQERVASVFLPRAQA